MYDSESFLREATKEDLRTLLSELLRRVHALEVGTRGRGVGWSHDIQPMAMFTSGVPKQWNGSKPVTVYVTGGTVSQISITGIAVNGSPITYNPGLTSGTFRLIPGDSITITYSAAPTWYWYGD